MSKKLKGQLNPLADLHFVSSLPLETSVQMVGSLASDKRTVTLTEVDTDTFAIEVQQSKHETFRGTVRVKGLLRRWQGTETRVDCDAFVGFDKGRFFKVYSLIVGIFLAFTLIIFAVGGDSTTIAVRNGEIESVTHTNGQIQPDKIPQGMALVLIYVVGLPLLIALLESFHTSKNSEKARGQLLEAMVKQFQAVGEVTWIDKHPQSILGNHNGEKT